MNYKKISFYLTVAFLIFLLTNTFTITSIQNSIEFVNGKNTKLDFNNEQYICFGFIIPLPSGNDSTYETFLTTKTMNLINDLLREDIYVYWSNESFLTLSAEIGINKIKNNSFEKGDFIVPFSGILQIDTLLMAIIYDYYYGSEIYGNAIKLKIYKITKEIDINSFKLFEPKIAQHLEKPVRYSWPCYLEIADSGGFFTMDFLLEGETFNLLNNEDYNIFMWPYKPHPARYIEVLKSLADFKSSNTVRNFIKNGGGYIGSCYGAIVASSGSFTPLPIFSLNRAYNTEMTSIPFFNLAVSDNYMRPFADKNNLYLSTVEIQDINHPLSFGLNKTSISFFDGAWFQRLGKNSENVATHKNIENTKEGKIVPILLEKSLVDSPAWVTSSFGEGKIVQFACHPEYVNNISILVKNLNWAGDPYYGRRIIYNSILYSSSRRDDIKTNFSYSSTNIFEIGNKTRGIKIKEKDFSIFKNLANSIIGVKSATSNLKNSSMATKKLYTSLNQGKQIDSEIIRLFSYVYFYSDIYEGYFNKTLVELKNLENIIATSNFSENNRIENLKFDMYSNLQKSWKKINDTNITIKNIDLILSTKLPENIKKILILEKSRYLLSNYEINLKYIPQNYFETVKLLRSIWYYYQTDIALDH